MKDRVGRIRRRNHCGPLTAPNSIPRWGTLLLQLPRTPGAMAAMRASARVQAFPIGKEAARGAEGSAYSKGIPTRRTRSASPAPLASQQSEHSSLLHSS
eukprot:scaffold275491_cov28-Tisochrysis_lutea.AAC.10